MKKAKLFLVICLTALLFIPALAHAEDDNLASMIQEALPDVFNPNTGFAAGGAGFVGNTGFGLDSAGVVSSDDITLNQTLTVPVIVNPPPPPPPPPPPYCLLAGTKIALANGTLKPIEDIKAGERVLGSTENGELVAVEVLETFIHPDIQSFYSIETEDGKTLRATGNHPVRNGSGYVEVADLDSGDALTVLSNDKITQTKIVSMKKHDTAVVVYNLEVDSVHNYFAEGYLVHNKPPLPENVKDELQP